MLMGWWISCVSANCCCYVFFFFKQKTAYEIRNCDWSSDVCSSDLGDEEEGTALIVI